MTLGLWASFPLEECIKVSFYSGLGMPESVREGRLVQHARAFDFERAEMRSWCPREHRFM